MEGIKKLIGNRVYLEVPKEKDTKIIVDHNTKKDLEKELLKTLNKLKVVAVGEGVGLTESSKGIVIEVGDLVLVDPSAIARANIVPITDELSVICVNYYDIMHVWQ